MVRPEVNTCQLCRLKIIVFTKGRSGGGEMKGYAPLIRASVCMRVGEVRGCATLMGVSEVTSETSELGMGSERLCDFGVRF